jgi:mannose-1-phosphate guanylyltransferase/mannose-6-phosphate isomerase
MHQTAELLQSHRWNVRHFYRGELTISASKRQIDRPWGSFVVIWTGDGHQVKVITIEPRQELSLQKHLLRRERWVVLSGCAVVQIGDDVCEMTPGDVANVPVGTRHRISNPGDGRLQVLETQFGDYLGEDDIVRFEDRYGRV